MKLQYHYSIFANFIFFIFGLVFLLGGIDLLTFHYFINPEQTPPAFVPYITIFFGFLLSSGFLMNLVKGKKYVITADGSGVKIYTGNITKVLSEIFIAWPNIEKIETRRIASTLRKGRTIHKVTALVFRIKKDLIQWPSVMISRNRISFKKYSLYDEIIIDAWLNKSMKKIVKEITELKSQSTTS